MRKRSEKQPFLKSLNNSEQPCATWHIYSPGPDNKEKRVPIAWNTFANPMAIDQNTFGYKWNYDIVAKSSAAKSQKVILPEYFHLEKVRPQKGKMGSSETGDRTYRNGFTADKVGDAKGESARALHYSRSNQNQLEDTGSEGGSLSGAPRGWQCGHLFLVSICGTTGAIECRFD